MVVRGQAWEGRKKWTNWVLGGCCCFSLNWIKRNEKIICIKEIQVAFKRMTRCSSSLTSREMQIERSPRYHFSPVSLAQQHICWQSCGETGSHIHYWWECKWVQPRQREIWQYLSQLPLHLHFDLDILLLRVNPEDTSQKYKNTHGQDYSFQNYL